MKRWSGIFQLAAVYVGTIIGAGFATGREIVEFFTRFGFIGLVGILISGYLFIFLGAKIMVKAHQIKAKSYEEFNEYLFGKWFSKFMNILMMLMLLGVTAVMLSGAGAVFEEQLEMNKQTGVLLSIFLGFIVMMIGMKGLFAVNTLVVPIMIIFNISIMLANIFEPGFIESLLKIPHADDGWKAVISPFSYAAFNLAMAQAVLVPVAAQVKDIKTVKYGGILGGVLLTIILISSHFTLIMIPDVTSYEIPMAIVMKSMAGSLYGIYIFIIFGEIFTSIIGGVFGLEQQMANYWDGRRIFITLIIFVIIYLLSFFEYSQLLSYLYPLFGYLSLLFIILLWMKPSGDKL
ncbi:GerAB/ArcD/ProY family transporter [Rossellomorea vietnamensis]|uniref:GerAB/ArcD/ProY family transporter n=1 Tax=Rossellomorea vietnamensis TaxID=218284 RepID=A0A5D4M803_9BACI|nr:GerAB/ArcD/ProY family transporter [Rossellomorea vietnamensis]TYR97607.1 GerAB/ArcD/ProY family transporter [Rossellomorea vietnamensis]